MRFIIKNVFFVFWKFKNGLGNFGGLLGLCIGFSLVHIVEIVYFATVRLYQNIPLVMNPKSNEDDDSTHSKIRSSSEDVRIREMYVNDFKRLKRHNSNVFHNRT